MLKLIKQNDVDWELLMSVLTGEMPDNHPDFIAWLEESEENKNLYESLICENNRDLQLFDTKKMYKKVIQTRRRKTAKFILPSWIRNVAAVVLIVASCTLYYTIEKQRKEPVVVQNENIILNDIEPGSKKARLVLANGSSLELKGQFKLEKENGIIINNDSAGLLSYQQQSHQQAKPEPQLVEIPLGGEYTLVLADGTKVYLNSGSSLRFPSFFEGNTRTVELTGEAYFDVTKNKACPFIIKTSGIEVLVWGTSFNISSYGEDNSINATLVSGLIEMKTSGSMEGHLLSPGQNLNFNKTSGQIKIENVDTDFYTAWIRGEFIFKNQNMENILTRLSKWYDFSFEFEDPAMKNFRFTGSVEKKRPLVYFLNQIEQVANLKFEIHGNIVKVSY